MSHSPSVTASRERVTDADWALLRSMRDDLARIQASIAARRARLKLLTRSDAP